MVSTIKSEDEKNDQVIKLLGKFGKWQLLQILSVCFSGIMNSWEVLVTSFLAPQVDYWCSIETPEGLIDDWKLWQNISSPLLEDGTKDKCNIYDIDYTSLTSLENMFSTLANSSKTRPCKQWSYDTSVHPRTIVTDFDLVCDRDWYVTLTQSMYMLGFMVGVFSSGLISDRFGRQRTFFFASMLLSIFAFSTAFASSVEVYIFLRCIVAATNATVGLIGYIYCMEIIGGRWKTWIGVGLEFPWALAYSVLPGIAYVLRDWSKLKIAVACPIFIEVVFFYFMPESPRWLISKGRLDEAKVVLEKAMVMNGTTWPQGFELQRIDNAETSSKDNEIQTKNKVTILDLFKTRNMLKKTLIQMYVWFTASFVYYGLTLNGDTLIPGDLYINFAVGGLLEFPANILTILLLQYFGRRIPQFGMYLTGGLFLILTLSTSSDYGKSVLSQLGKFGVTCAFSSIYVYAAELYPTVLRSTGMGMSSMIARVGSILAPIVGRELGRKNQEGAIVIFGVTSILAGVLTLFLPETLGQKLPDSLEEGEEFGKNESIRDLFRRRKIATNSDEQDQKPTECDNQAFSPEKSP